MSGFRNVAETPQEEARNPGLCVANGCRLRGTVASGEGFACFVHATSDWRQANDALRANERIVYALDKVLATGDADWSMGGWKALDAFFTAPELKPSVPERSKRRWYEYRLRQWLLHLAGDGPKPEPRQELASPSMRLGKAPI